MARPVWTGLALEGQGKKEFRGRKAPKDRRFASVAEGIWGLGTRIAREGGLPVAASVFDGFQQRLFRGGAAEAGVAGHVGVGDAEFGAAAGKIGRKALEGDAAAGPVLSLVGRGHLLLRTRRRFHTGRDVQDSPCQRSGEGVAVFSLGPAFRGLCRMHIGPCGRRSGLPLK